MPLSHLAQMPRKLQIAVVIFSVVTAAFFGAALFAVWNGREENAGICDAVVGLRTDLVQVLEDQRGKAEANARKLGLDTVQLQKDYDNMIAKIGDRDCP